MDWEIVYEKAIRDDGSLFFPERLSREFLDNARKVMGSYLFANQYQNEIIPTDEIVFKPEWIRYYTELPKRKYTFAFVDPAISLEDTADYTGVIVVDVDTTNTWYVRVANRYRITPTQTVDLIFRIIKEYNPMCIGVESVAYQKALIYMIDVASRDKKVVAPIKEIKPDTDVSKEYRIMGLVPRFEWGRIFINRGLKDLEDELSSFPRAAHDDLIDSLSNIERIAVAPEVERLTEKPPNPSQGGEYEKWYINQTSKQQRDGESY